VNGDDLVFPGVGALDRSVRNDIFNLTVKSIRIEGIDFRLSGDAIRLTEGIVVRLRRHVLSGCELGRRQVRDVHISSRHVAGHLHPTSVRGSRPAGSPRESNPRAACLARRTRRIQYCHIARPGPQLTRSRCSRDSENTLFPRGKISSQCHMFLVAGHAKIRTLRFAAVIAEESPCRCSPVHAVAIGESPDECRPAGFRTGLHNRPPRLADRSCTLSEKPVATLNGKFRNVVLGQVCG
jgi:hypothetical protein